MFPWERRPAILAFIIFATNGFLAPWYLDHLPQPVALAVIGSSVVVVGALSEWSVRRKRRLSTGSAPHSSGSQGSPSSRSTSVDRPE